MRAGVLARQSCTRPARTALIEARPGAGRSRYD